MQPYNIPVVILCGGRGMRLNDLTAETPKPLVEIGGKPILWHIMGGYAAEGYKRFILCLGYRGDQIREFAESAKDWEVVCVDTGLDTETGGRFLAIEEHVDAPMFFATYGDNVSNVSAAALLAEHQRIGCVATVTCVHARTTFGIIDADVNGIVTSYREKPRLDLHVNGGFYCFNKDVFRYIDGDEVFEKEPLQRLVAARQLAEYAHDGFWSCMDTYKDYRELNDVWSKGSAPWQR